jgi:hypothetical protein
MFQVGAFQAEGFVMQCTPNAVELILLGPRSAIEGIAYNVAMGLINIAERTPIGARDL